MLVKISQYLKKFLRGASAIFVASYSETSRFQSLFPGNIIIC